MRLIKLIDSDGQPIVEEVKGPEFSKFPQLATCPQCHKQVGDNNINVKSKI